MPANARTARFVTRAGAALFAAALVGGCANSPSYSARTSPYQTTSRPLVLGTGDAFGAIAYARATGTDLGDDRFAQGGTEAMPLATASVPVD